MTAFLAVYALGLCIGLAGVGSMLYFHRRYPYELRPSDLKVWLAVALMFQSQHLQLLPLYGRAVDRLPRVEFVTRDLGVCPQEGP